MAASHFTSPTHSIHTANRPRARQSHKQLLSSKDRPTTRRISFFATPGRLAGCSLLRLLQALGRARRERGVLIGRWPIGSYSFSLWLTLTALTAELVTLAPAEPCEPCQRHLVVHVHANVIRPGRKDEAQVANILVTTTARVSATACTSRFDCLGVTVQNSTRTLQLQLYPDLEIPFPLVAPLLFACAKSS